MWQASSRIAGKMNFLVIKRNEAEPSEGFDLPVYPWINLTKDSVGKSWAATHMLFNRADSSCWTGTGYLRKEKPGGPY